MELCSGEVLRELQVLLCDDDPQFLRRLEQQTAAFFKKQGIRARICCFSAGEDISETLFFTWDVALLDVDFPRKRINGLDIARKLRAANRDGVLLFITNYVEYAPEGYEVQAFRYILKSELEQKLQQNLQQAIHQLRSARQTLLIRINGEPIELLLEDLIYLESQKHTVIAYIRRGSSVKTYSFYASLSSLEETLVDRGFLRIHKSYLVNMQHLRNYRCKEALLTGDIRLRVSEKNYGEQKKKYLLWKGRQ